jgi:carbon storage regulator
MLVLTRRKGEKIIVGDNIEITILDIPRKKVRFGIKAPKEVPVHIRLKALPSSEAKVAQHRKNDPKTTN